MSTHYLLVVSRAGEFLGGHLPFCPSFTHCVSAVWQQNITVKTFDLNLIFSFKEKPIHQVGETAAHTLKSCQRQMAAKI